MQLSTLLAAPLACCRLELEGRRMVPPSNEALRLIIETDPALVSDLNQFYGDATADGGLDKAERDRLLDLLGRHYINRSWPRSGGMDVTRRFMGTLQRAMTAAGWKLDAFAIAA
jgi:hypothetical protein